MASSSRTGQPSLQPPPSLSVSSKRRTDTYSLPEELLHDRATLKNHEVGLNVLKLSKTGKLQPRRIAVSPDRRTVLVTTNRIKSIKGLFKAATGREATVKKIPVACMDRIQRGPNSHRFRLAAELHTAGSHGDGEEAGIIERMMDPEKGVALSIVYYNHAADVSSVSALEMLDLVVPSVQDYEVLLTALEDLVALNLEDRQRYIGDIQYLHHLWNELDKDWETPINLNEFMHLTDKMNLPLSKPTLASLFRDTHTETLSLPQVSKLLESIKTMTSQQEHDPIEQLWTQLVESDPIPMAVTPPGASISAVAFLAFLRSSQKQYQTKLEQVIDLVHALNQQATPEEWSPIENPQGAPGDVDRLSKARFAAFVKSDANDVMDPEKAKVAADDMSQPLSHYWISTSHDTYLEALPHSFQGRSVYSNEKVSMAVDDQAYTAALLRGVRCLEIDVWDSPVDGPEREPVVAQRQPTADHWQSQSIPLTTVLQTIRYFLQQHPYTFPILLRMENHCSKQVQSQVAKSIYTVLGSARLLYKPEKELADEIKLPSPDSARGKVILMGKRPKEGSSIVINDDFDVDNDEWEPALETSTTNYPMERDEGATGTVIWFDAHGPIRTQDPQAKARSPAELWKAATSEAQQAQAELDAAKQKEADLRRRANEQENLTAQLTLQAGLSPAQVKSRAAAMQKANGGPPPTAVMPSTRFYSEEKTGEDEGVEVTDVLPQLVQGGKDRYSMAAQQAMSAAQHLRKCQERLRTAEMAQQNAIEDLARARQQEEVIAQQAKAAATEAWTHREHATSAQERVKEVRTMLQNSEGKTSTAGTVVQTALTEARVSEKRATEAEARAARAQAAAEKDRNRSDDETRNEEEMEQQVADLHEQVKRAGDVALEAKERLEKATVMLDRANEQIRLIENSSQFRQEQMEQQNGQDVSRAPFLAKHALKVEERDRCRDLIREASEEHKSAETKRKQIQSQFEDRAHAWRVQADRASQARRSADRSAHLADELAEHAEEEREAAALRHVARERAEAAVASRGNQHHSLEAQLAEAERASAEAAKVAVQSRNRAESLAREAEQAKDHSVAEREVEATKWEALQAQGEYESAALVKDTKDRDMATEKRRADAAAELYDDAERTMEKSRVKVEPLYEEEAIVAFNTALLLREETENASKITEMATNGANTKYLIAKRAREYKETKEMSTEIPSSLARLTLLHTTRFRQWSTSLALSNVQVHSLAQHVLQKMVQSDTEDQHANFEAFTKNHLCRLFPSWLHVRAENVSNYDPTYAWSLGCQLVAMNLHTADENTSIADGRFRKNGSCGYVLKPRSLTHNDAGKPEAMGRWSFEILSGSCLPSCGSHTLNPFVVVSLSTGRDTEPLILFRTNTVASNGLNPVWEKNQVLMDIETPSIAMVNFVVWNKINDRSDEFIAAASVPACCLREGYRSVSLFDGRHARNGPFAHASLFVNACKR